MSGQLGQIRLDQIMRSGQTKSDKIQSDQISRGKEAKRQFNAW